MRTIIEPFRIKSVEPLHQTTRPTPSDNWKQAGYNLFPIDARQF